jgi:hypothetical protein
MTGPLPLRSPHSSSLAITATVRASHQSILLPWRCSLLITSKSAYPASSPSCSSPSSASACLVSSGSWLACKSSKHQRSSILPISSILHSRQGATDDAINTIPLITVKEETLEGVDNTCPICLNDMALGEQVRLLPCKHIFHSQVIIPSIASSCTYRAQLVCRRVASCECELSDLSNGSVPRARGRWSC